MRKKVYGRHLGRERDTRVALFRSLIKALVYNGKIKTTKAKAKAIQKDADRVVRLAKEGTLPARRRVYAYLANDRVTTDKLFDRIAKSFSGRTSGFTRAVALGRRRGDASEMVRLEWTEEIVTSDKKHVTSKKEDKGGKTRGRSLKLSKVKEAKSKSKK